MNQEENEGNSNENLERTSYLSEYSRYVYDQSIDRFGRIDTKAAGLLSVTIIVIGIVLSLGDWWIFTGLSGRQERFFSIASWVLVGAILSSAGFTIGHSIKTLKVHYVPVPPLTEEVFDYVYTHSLSDTRGGAANTLLEASQLNQSNFHIQDQKSQKVHFFIVFPKLLRTIVCSFLTFIACIVVLVSE